MFTSEERLSALREVFRGQDCHMTNNQTHFDWVCIHCLNEGGDDKDRFHFDLTSNKYNCFCNQEHTRRYSLAIREFYKSRRQFKKKKDPLSLLSILDAPQEIDDYLGDRKLKKEALHSLGVQYDQTYGLLYIPSIIHGKAKLKDIFSKQVWWEEEFLSSKKIPNDEQEKFSKEYPVKKYAGQKNIIILEGLPDIWGAASFFSEEFFSEYYVTAHVHGCTYIPPEWKDPLYWTKFNNIYIIPHQDRNQAGQNAAKKIASFIQNKKVNMIMLPLKHKRMIFGEELDYPATDFNDWMIEGGTFEGFNDLLATGTETDRLVDDAAHQYLKNPNMIEEFISDMRKIGIVGEEENLVRLYLCCISYKLEKCLGVILKGATSSGKTTLIKAVIKLMPPGIVSMVTSQSEQALNYWTDISHRIIVITEEKPPEDTFWEVMSAWRQLIEDDEITRVIVDNNEKDIEKKRKEIKVKGPIVYLSSTTQAQLHEENENRLFMFHTDDTPEHVEKIIHEVIHSDDEVDSEQSKFIIKKHQRAIELLQPYSFSKIKIPYRNQISFNAYGPEASRDIKKLIRVIQVCTYLHQYQRQVPQVPAPAQRGGADGILGFTQELPAESTKKTSAAQKPGERGGKIILSKVKDYELIYKYFLSYFEANSSNMPKSLQDKWVVINNYVGDNSTFTYKDCTKKWNLKRSAVQRIVAQMMEKDMVVKVEKTDDMYKDGKQKETQFRCIAWNLAGSGLRELNENSSAETKKTLVGSMRQEPALPYEEIKTLNHVPTRTSENGEKGRIAYEKMKYLFTSDLESEELDVR